MKRLTGALAIMALALCDHARAVARSEPDSDSGMPLYEAVEENSHPLESMPAVRQGGGNSDLDGGRRGSSLMPEEYVRHLGRDSSVFAYSGQAVDPVFGLAPSAYQQWTVGLDSGDTEAVRAQSHDGPGSLTLGYAWKKFRLEGSAFRIGREDPVNGAMRDLGVLDSTASRVSYQPSANWIFQLSRGNLSNLDQLESGEGLRRTALSASYRSRFEGGDLRTTVAWGRNVRKTTGATVGYLVESTLRFSDRHAVFGRLERARSTEDGAYTENLQRQMFRTNRLSFGYYLDLSGTNAFRYDVGALVTRYLNSPSPSGAYASDPSTAMMFVRLWLP